MLRYLAQLLVSATLTTMKMTMVESRLMMLGMFCL
jgi:hypothetical protein